MDAVVQAAQAIGSGQSEFMLAGGVESMSRAPFVMPKAEKAFSRSNSIEDTTIGWRLINEKMEALYGCDSMPETAENVANCFHVSREDQDAFALRSQQRYAAAQENGFFETERFSVSIPQSKSDPIVFSTDEHPRPNTVIEHLQRLRPVVNPQGTVTAGNASGVNDGAAAIILASEAMAIRQRFNPIAKVLASATAGVEPRTMGMGPVPAVKKLLEKTGLSLSDIDVIELNEAFAAQGLACMRELGLPDDAEHVNPNGGAIALGHPLGASGARLIMTAAYQLQKISGKFAICSMCVGVGQGIAVLIGRI
jgi:acetyl-CoA acetyltransferase family protein